MQSQRRQSDSINADATGLTLAVKDMSCEHCKVAITLGVSRVSGVESVEVDLDRKLVHVHGTNFDGTAVVGAVDEAGYDAVAP